jgi:Helix-turn-helix domain
MTPIDLEAFRVRMKWRRKELGAALEISQDRLRRLLDGRSPIPRHIALACSALALGVLPMGKIGQAD